MYHYDAVTSDANLDTQHRTAKNLRFLRIAHTMSRKKSAKRSTFRVRSIPAWKTGQKKPHSRSFMHYPCYITSASSI